MKAGKRADQAHETKAGNAGSKRSMVLICGLMVLAPLALGQEYAVTGTLEFKEYSRTTRESNHVYGFSMAVDECRWVMRVVERSSGAFDYLLAAHDGKEVYTVTSIETLVRQNPNPSHVAVASIGSGGIPQDAYTFMKDLWLAYASRCYFASLTNEWVAPLYFNRNDASSVSPPFALKARWSLLPGTAPLPAEAVFTFQFEGKFLPQDKNYEQWMKHTNAHYQVSQFTNVGLISVPTEFAVHHYSRDGFQTHKTTVFATVSPGGHQTPLFRPLLPGRSYIADYRQTGPVTGFAPAVYYSTGWPSLKQAEPAFLLAQANAVQGAAAAREDLRRQSPRKVTVLILLIIFTGAPLAFYCAHCLKKKYVNTK